MEQWLRLTLELPAFSMPLIAGVLLLAGVGVALYSRKRKDEGRVIAAEAEKARIAVADAEKRRAEWESARDDYRYFIYNVSHEVSNPLQSIQTNLDNMTAGLPEHENGWREQYQVIGDEIRRLGRLTENLRLLSRLEAPRVFSERQSVNLKAVIESVIMARAPEAEARGLQLVYVGVTTPARILGNRDGLQQVLFNLLDNSIKFSRADSESITISLDRNEEWIVLRVSDDGIGISEADLPHVFDLTYRSPDAWSYRVRGSGLGLPIARRIVEEHQGRIRMESRLGAGTTVIIELPPGGSDQARLM